MLPQAFMLAAPCRPTTSLLRNRKMRGSGLGAAFGGVIYEDVYGSSDRHINR